MTAGVIVAGRPMPQFERLHIEPLSGACGCEISGVDISKPLGERELVEVMAAFEHFLVLVFRDQPLTIEQHRAFSRYFGELTEVPQAPIFAGHEDIQEVRLEANEPPTVVPSFEDFHIDSPFLEQPPLCALMRPLELPRYGGDTVFSNLFLAYEDLSTGFKQLLAQLRILYSGKDIWSRNAKRDQSNRLRLRDRPDAGQLRLESVHPAVRTHPHTGRKGLFVSRGYFRKFVGWSEEESRVLLNYLHPLLHRPQYQCRVRWRPDTLVVWDNRFLQHRGIGDFCNERRHLVRTTIIGERPV